MTDLRFQETLQYLYERLPMFQRVGAPAMKKGLDNTLNLCWELGMPQWKFPSIHVAGTNGKGSVSSLLASILTEAGYRTGLYTSPHLVSFTERIRIDGRPISEESVVEWVDCYRLVIEQIKPSFFELTVGMAFEYFAESQIDMGVVEVGLGGRLDSTNVIRPELSVITNIGWDHMDLLGDSLDKIAAEKAGIIKKYTPVVVGRRQAETEQVFAKKAFEQAAPLHFAEDRFAPKALGHEQGYQRFRVGRKVYDLDLLGDFQAENLATALMAVEQLREDGWHISEEALRRGLRNVRKNSGLRGRMEELQSHPQVICDVAHNRDGLAVVLPQIKALAQGRQLHVVWGMAADKDHDPILSQLPREAQYYWVKPDLPRGLEAETLRQKAAAHGLQGRVSPSVAVGIKAALASASPQDLIYIGGSNFVVAEALPHWESVLAPQGEAV
jgi:dihydrofolate synthase / folylpolyglutamate synthase